MCPPYWTVTLVSGAGAEGVPVAVTVGALRSSTPGVAGAPAVPVPFVLGRSRRPRAPSPPPSPPPPRPAPSSLARVSGTMSPADAKRGAKRRKNKRGGGLSSTGGPGPSGGGGAGGLGKAGAAAGAAPLRAATQAAAVSPSAVGGLLTAPATAASNGALGGGGASAGHGEVRRRPGRAAVTSRCGGPGTHPPGRAVLAAGRLPPRHPPSPLALSGWCGAPRPQRGGGTRVLGPSQRWGAAALPCVAERWGWAVSPAPHPLWGKGNAGCLELCRPGFLLKSRQEPVPGSSSSGVLELGPHLNGGAVRNRWPGLEKAKIHLCVFIFPLLLEAFLQ